MPDASGAGSVICDVGPSRAMTVGEPQQDRSSAPSPELSSGGPFWRRALGVRVIVLFAALIGLGVVWFFGLLDRPIDQWLDSGRVYKLRNCQKMDDRPLLLRFGERPLVDVASKCVAFCTPQLLVPKLKRKVMDRLGKGNPAAWRIPATPCQQRFLYQELNDCGQMTGTRYLIAHEAWGRRLWFGTTNVLNGAQWAAALERALCDDGLMLIPVRRGVVKVIPKDKLDEYQRAGLVKRGDLARSALSSSTARQRSPTKMRGRQRARLSGWECGETQPGRAAYLAGWTKRLRRAEDVRGEVGGGGWIPPGGAALRRGQRAGLGGCSEPWAAWRARSEGVRSGRRRRKTKPGRDRCDAQAAQRLRADMGCGCWAEGS